ncbi:hypothetical protein [Streptomyces ochraceiscleroticus]|uniref:Uncharacterized protein n=1 Tax=Streptomyces ochraceiscleroticus TaxID=47761 RepID=A0ABW1MN04_9ACTN|nr:hypothetical protein [Streptomyces ochraceiscleroticus]
MTTKYLARLQFTPDGVAVEGEWTVPATARNRYTEWVGRYGSDPAVVIELMEDIDGRQRVLKTWTAQDEVEGPARP